MKKFLSCMLSVSLAMTLLAGAACNFDPRSKYGNKTIISVLVPQGGLGTEWMKAAAQRYETLNADKELEPGKKGVKIEVDQGTNSWQLSTTDSHDVIVSHFNFINGYVQRGLVLDITELWNRPSAYDGVAIKDKVHLDATYNVNGGDGKYYALPYYESYSGVSYNRDVFNKHGLYFTDDTANGTLVTTSYGNAYFVSDDEPVSDGNYPCVPSNGPDHKPGTADDGLPSTLHELLILCGYMKSLNIDPFIFTGQYPIYSNNLTCGLWLSLAGYDQFQTFYSYNGGPVEVVKTTLNATQDGGTTLSLINYENKPLLPGLTNSSSVKKPETTWVEEINMTNGYYVDDMVAKYYAIAFMEICEKEGFFSNYSKSGSFSHTDAQLAFLAGGYGNNKEVGMLCESAYWWNEADLENKLDDYEIISGKKAKDADVRFMPLPTALDAEAVEKREQYYEQIGKTCDWSNTLSNSILSTIFIPTQAGGDSNHVNALFDFMDFLTSKDELKNTTQSLGLVCPYDYYNENDNLCENKSLFSKDLFNLRATSKFIDFGYDSTLFRSKFANRYLTTYTPIFMNEHTLEIILQLRENKLDTDRIFNGLRQTIDAWNAFSNV